MDFVSNTELEQKEMLESIGSSSVKSLFSDIPEKLRESFQPLDIQGLSELELKRKITSLARKNNVENRTSFIGGGAYDHFIPSIVQHITGRSEFYTAYTPYQAEISQGTLTWMFEFQTAICELTGMEIANSSMYDGATAAAEACLMASRVTGNSKLIISQSIHPYYRDVVETYLINDKTRVIDLPQNRGRIDKGKLKQIIDRQDDIAGFIIQSPNFFGIVEDLSELKQLLGDRFLIVNFNPIALGMLAPPGKFNADIAIGEGQPLGNSLNYGGPYLGLFATREKYLRYLPGRISGQTVDTHGKTGYVMALQTREQHIRRERATSNICTNQALNALAATVYLAAVGPQGLQKIAEQNWDKAHYLARELTDLGWTKLTWNQPFFNEFLLTLDCNPVQIWENLKSRGIDLLHPDYLKPLGLDNHLLLTVTEKTTSAEMEQLVTEMKNSL